MRFRSLTAWATLLLLAAGCGEQKGGGPAAAGVARTRPGVTWTTAFEDTAVRTDPRIVALGPDDVWVFGGRRPEDAAGWPAAWHWNGRDWTRSDPSGGRVGAVLAAGASSASDVWAVTGGGSGSGATVLHWDGARWTVDRRLPGFSVTDIEVLSPQDVRVYGVTGPAHGVAWTRTAAGWSRAALPFPPTEVSARSARDVWAISFDQRLFHHDGARWRPVSLGRALPPGGRHQLMQVTATARGVWLTAEVTGDEPPRSIPSGQDAPPAEPNGGPAGPRGAVGPVLSSYLLRGDPAGSRWTAENVTTKAGRLNEAAAPVTDADGGVWLIGSLDVNAYESALAYRTPAGAWTRAAVRAPRFGTFEVRAFARVPGTGRFLVAGMDDERGAVLSASPPAN